MLAELPNSEPGRIGDGAEMFGRPPLMGGWCRGDEFVGMEAFDVGGRFAGTLGARLRLCELRLLASDCASARLESTVTDWLYECCDRGGRFVSFRRCELLLAMLLLE